MALEFINEIRASPRVSMLHLAAERSWARRDAPARDPSSWLSNAIAALPDRSCRTVPLYRDRWQHAAGHVVRRDEDDEDDEGGEDDEDDEGACSRAFQAWRDVRKRSCVLHKQIKKMCVHPVA
ncbi:hypothetical protein [Sorangium sp. So ce1182]|uniref:hypothetical protein n=1 Tax=Sorangium sp. So ce1182 TaxID=3133334 RepID=UPI003F60BC14